MPEALVAVVTGGSSGIGAALVRRWAARGYRVVVADIEPHSPDAIFVDVGDLDSCHELMAQVVARHGRVDMVALNAGINARQRGGDPLDIKAYRSHLAVNLDGVVFGIDAATKAFGEHGGSIVVTASLAALAPEVSNPLYTLAKSGVLGYIRSMAPLLQPRGITINAVCPAFVDTPMLEDRRERLVGKGFPLIDPGDVAAALESAVDSGLTGMAWAMVPGREPYIYEFAGLPEPLLPNGDPAPSLS